MRLIDSEKKKKESGTETEEMIDPEEEFQKTMKKNEENFERMKKDRDKDNKSVTRSYRLKR